MASCCHDGEGYLVPKIYLALLMAEAVIGHCSLG